MAKNESPDQKRALWHCLSAAQWRERILACDLSWFVLTMGTGIIVQLLDNFPWPAKWLRDLAYCFWILNIVLFSFFTAMTVLRIILFPSVVRALFSDINQTSYLGAVASGYDTIVAGMILNYSSRPAGPYVAEAFYWVAVALTTFATLGGIFATYKTQGNHQIKNVTGIWLLIPIPMIVTSALGSNLVPYMSGGNAATVLFVSFFMLSLGFGVAFMITTIYFWRLLSCSLPPRDAIVSCFVPVGPPGMSAFSIAGLSADLAKYVAQGRFSFDNTGSVAIDATGRAAVAQTIEWLGVFVALALLGIATFFLIEAFASFTAKIPKSFSIGWWSFVFPCGVYSNAFCRLSTNLHNNGMKGWAAACVMGTILLWLMCALMTLYKGVVQGQLFIAPAMLHNHLHDLPSEKRRKVAPDGTYQTLDLDKENRSEV